MKKLFGLLLLACLPLLSFGQARNTGIKLKGPLYQDNVLIITKNLVQVRLEAPFYAYSYVNETYKKKVSTPILLGVRYERLVAGHTAFCFELEYNSYDAKAVEGGPPVEVPKDQSYLKVSPIIRQYFRKDRKAIFRGLFVQGGLSLISINQSLDETQLARRAYVFKPATLFGITAGLGVQHTFGQALVIGAAADVTFCGEQFTQETLYRTNVGNGAMYFNPFKFYVGARF